MRSFIGDYICKLDARGRVLLPSAFQKQMEESSNDTFVLKKDVYEQCLILYTIDEWENQNKILREKLNPYNREHSKLLRAYFRGTAEIKLDTNNRLLFPKRLLELANIKKEICLSGQDKKIEVWAKEIYDAMEIEQDEFSQLAEKILGNNISE